jgi:L-asparaginase
MQSSASKVVILGTGGTIAGAASRADDHVGYTAGQITAAQLLQGVPTLAGADLEVEQVAQLDSKDMDFATWRQLAQRVQHHLGRDEVAGVVITHGTDTLEETAYFLHRVLGPAKPVVMTAAMRPATALSADGPQNLADAVAVAQTAGARGVLVALHGRVHAAEGLRKRHAYQVDAFASGDAGPVALIEDGQVRLLKPWPAAAGCGLSHLPAAADAWPWVELVTSRAGADARGVDALVEAGVRGLLIAGTGNGTVHRTLLDAVDRAQARGVAVWRASRCAEGSVVGRGELPSAGPLTAVQARIALMLHLLGCDA